MDGEADINVFVEALGSSAPTPGGGAVSALVGALGAALAEMVARFTVGRKRYLAVEPQASDILQRAVAARTALLELVAEDERAFQVVTDAYQRPKATDDEKRKRETAIQVALVVAMRPPMRTVHLAREAVALALEIAQIGNVTVLSDAACAATLGEAACRSAALNVLANVSLLHDTAVGEGALTEARTALGEAVRLRDDTLTTVYQRMGVTGL
jgi:formiminotetrahydrofolate cyclodeaminase